MPLNHKFCHISFLLKWYFLHHFSHFSLCMTCILLHTFYHSKSLNTIKYSKKKKLWSHEMTDLWLYLLCYYTTSQNCFYIRTWNCANPNQCGNPNPCFRDMVPHIWLPHKLSVISFAAKPVPFCDRSLDCSRDTCECCSIYKKSMDFIFVGFFETCFHCTILSVLELIP